MNRWSVNEGLGMKEGVMTGGDCWVGGESVVISMIWVVRVEWCDC